MQVDIQSRDNSARDRRTEVLAALHSTYAEEVQEANGCRIFSIPQSFTNTGNKQGGSSLNRWSIRFKMTYKQVHTLGIDYCVKYTFYESPIRTILLSNNATYEKASIYHYLHHLSCGVWWSQQQTATTLYREV